LQAREAIRDDDSRERLQSPYGRDDPTTGAEVARVPVPIHTESLHPDRNIDAPAVDLDAIDPDPPDTDDPIGPTSPDRTPAGGAEARPARRGAPTPEAPSSLAEELVRFNPVREALNAEKPLQALAALDAYDRAFPSGTFRAESQLSRVTALCQLGRGDEAQRLRDDFVRRHPGSHLAPRMREVCPDAP
jgi:hypothetical protein